MPPKLTKEDMQQKTAEMEAERRKYDSDLRVSFFSTPQERFRPSQEVKHMSKEDMLQKIADMAAERCKQDSEFRK